MENLSTSCPICFEPYTSDPSRKDECLPVQSAKCPHVLCRDCVKDIRDTAESTSPDEKSTKCGWITCPTCQASSSFNADDPTVCLTMCEFVKFAEDAQKQKEATAQPGDAKVTTQSKCNNKKKPPPRMSAKSSEPGAKRSRREIKPESKEREAKTTRRKDAKCRYCKHHKRINEFCSTQPNERKRICIRCDEKRKKGRKHGKSSKGNHTHIFLASAPGAKGKFLATVVPLVERAQAGDLPRELTLDGFTRQHWSTADGDGLGPWKTMHLRSVDKKRYLEGFLKDLKEREKAAFGTYLLPDGTDGFFVVPFNQPSLCTDASATRNEKVVFCKYVLGMNLVGVDSEVTNTKDSIVKNDVDKDSTKSIERKPTGMTPSDCSSSRTACPDLNSLEGIFNAQRKTERHLAAVAKMPKRKATHGLQGPQHGNPSGQDWFSIRLELSDDHRDE